MRLLGSCGSYQSQIIQAQELDLKQAKQGSAPGSCRLRVKFIISEQRSLFSKHIGEGPSSILLKPGTRKEARER